MSETNYDIIDNLPTDQNNPTHQEIQIVDSLFKEKHSTIDRLFRGIKDLLVIGFIFTLFSLPCTDKVINRFVPLSNNSIYILILVKALLFIFVFFVVQNLYLVRKNK